MSYTGVTAACIGVGIKSCADMAKVLSLPTETLVNWYKNDREKFDLYLCEAVVKLQHRSHRRKLA